MGFIGVNGFYTGATAFISLFRKLILIAMYQSLYFHFLNYLQKCDMKSTECYITHKHSQYLKGNIVLQNIFKCILIVRTFIGKLITVFSMMFLNYVIPSYNFHNPTCACSNCTLLHVDQSSESEHVCRSRHACHYLMRATSSDVLHV